MKKSDISTQSTMIKELKQKLHKSFIDLSNLQQLYKEEIQSLKDQYEKKVSQLENQNILLKSKLVQLEPSLYDKTFTSIFNEMDQSVIMPGIKKKASLFLQDQSFIQLTKTPHDLWEIKSKILTLQRDIKRQIGVRITSTMSEYFETVRNMMQGYFSTSEQLQKVKESLQNAQKVKQLQKNKLRDQVNELTQINIKLNKDCQRISTLYNSQAISLDNLRKQKQKHVNLSASSKNLKHDDLYGSKKTTDSVELVKQKNISLMSPKSRLFNQNPYQNGQH